MSNSNGINKTINIYNNLISWIEQKGYFIHTINKPDIKNPFEFTIGVGDYVSFKFKVLQDYIDLETCINNFSESFYNVDDCHFSKDNHLNLLHLEQELSYFLDANV